MKQIRQAWHYLLFEPFTWVILCFFQPVRFVNDFGKRNILQRVGSMIRLALPIFLISYPLAFIIQSILFHFLPTHAELGSYPGLSDLLSTTGLATLLSIGLGVIAGAIGDTRLGILLGIALGVTGSLTGNIKSGIVSGIIIAIALGLAGGTAGGISWRVIGGIIGGIVGGIAWGITEGVSSISGGIIIAAAFFVSYLFGYIRLPLYPASGLSGLKMHHASRKKPEEVFTYLHRSSLYWDELIFLPLPGLKRTLLIAIGQDAAVTRQEIAFIVTQRPQQIVAARIALLEIVIHDLEGCHNLLSIAQASYRLDEILSQEVGQIVSQWATYFARLSDASRDAARYCSPLDRRTRREALAHMIGNLTEINLHTTFENTRLTQRLGLVVNEWLGLAQQEQEQLAQAPPEIGQIDNPFSPGEVLKQSDSLFVGRRDLVQLLENALSKKSSRPTFFLSGERRMGKTSTLKQLPKLLGARYLPIAYDLQTTGITSSAVAFLSAMAEEIFRVAQIRSMQIKKLDTDLLSKASQKNEAAVYVPFDGWLRNLERTLEQQDRTLLLAFDEFEKLEEAGQAGYLNLRLLLDWFRSVIQNRPRLALLFSGVRTIGEMGTETDINWANYFVNVQTLKVSFLQPGEAHKLITQPQPNFLSDRIFGDGVVDEIIKVTSCHPFLIQAVCSALIDNLNANERECATLEDVNVAVHQVLENWWDTYFRDLWQRTEQDQRICLITLGSLSRGDLQKIAQHSGLDEKSAHQTLQTLLKRDLVQYINGYYQIAAPIFSSWVERNR